MTARRRVSPGLVIACILVFAVGIGVVVNLFVGIFAAYLLAGVDGRALTGREGPVAAAHARHALEQATTSLPVTTLSMVLTFAGFSLAAIVGARTAGLPVRPTLGLVHPTRRPTYALAAVGILLLGPVSDRLVALAEALAPEWSLGALQNLEVVVLGTPVPLALVLFAVMPGISEELLCRGLIQRAIARPAWAITVSALAFAAMHVDPHHVVGVLPLGVYLAWLAHRTGSTLVTMVAHATNNAVAVLLAHLSGASSTAHVSWPVVGVAVVLAAGVVYAIARLEPGASSGSPDDLAPLA